MLISSSNDFVSSVDISKIRQCYQLADVYDGNHITLQCKVHQNDGPERWHYAESPITQQRVIFNGNSADSNYVDRVSVTEAHNMSLNNVQMNESGWYTCVKDGGFYSTWLDVHG
jgi:hypothetical protein